MNRYKRLEGSVMSKSRMNAYNLLSNLTNDDGTPLFTSDYLIKIYGIKNHIRKGKIDKIRSYE